MRAAPGQKRERGAGRVRGRANRWPSGGHWKSTHWPQSVSCRSSIENIASACTAIFRTMQRRPVSSSSCHVVGARRDASDPQPLVVLDRSVAIVPALVWTPAVLARRGHPQLRDRVQCEIPKPDAFALLRHRTTAVSEGNRDKQQAKDFRCVTAQRNHSRKRRSRLRALSKFLAASSPIGAMSRVDARSAPRKSVPATTDLDESRAAQCGACERGIGQVRIPQRREFQVCA